MKNLILVLALMLGLVLSTGLVAMAFQGFRADGDTNVNGISDAGLDSMSQEMPPRDEIRDRLMTRASKLFAGEKAVVLEKILDEMDTCRADPGRFQETSLNLSGGPDAVSCEVQDSGGFPLTVVNAFTYGEFANWLQFSSGGTASTEVNFLVVPLFAGCPLALIWHVFQLNPASSTNIITPFGIPFWASNLTSGNWALIVLNNLGEVAVYFFNVV